MDLELGTITLLFPTFPDARDPTVDVENVLRNPFLNIHSKTKIQLHIEHTCWKQNVPNADSLNVNGTICQIMAWCVGES